MDSRAAVLLLAFNLAGCQAPEPPVEQHDSISDLEYELFSDALHQLLDDFSPEKYYLAVRESSIVVHAPRPAQRRRNVIEVDSLDWAPTSRANESLFMTRTRVLREGIMMDSELVAEYNRIAQRRCLVDNRFEESLSVHLFSGGTEIPAELRWEPKPDGSFPSSRMPGAMVAFTRAAFDEDSVFALFQCELWRLKSGENSLTPSYYTYGYGNFVLARLAAGGQWRIVTTRQTWIT